MTQESGIESEARKPGTNTGRVIMNKQTGDIEYYDESGVLRRRSTWEHDTFFDENGNEVLSTGDMRSRAISGSQFGMVFKDVNGDDKVFIGPEDSRVLEIFFAGLLEATIVGGSLDGVTYSTYVLAFRLHHDFSERYPGLTPLYFFWDRRIGSSSESESLRALTLGSVSPSGGTYTEANSHQMYRDDINGVQNEYLEMLWNVSRTAGTVTISPRTMRVIPIIAYVNEPLTLTPASVQGGGGGTLAEIFNFYA